MNRLMLIALICVTGVFAVSAQEATPEIVPESTPAVLPDGTACAWNGYVLLDNVYLEEEQIGMIATLTPLQVDTPPAFMLQTVTTDDGAGWIFEACWLELPERWKIVALAGQIGGSRDMLDTTMVYEALGGLESSREESAEAARAWIDENGIRFDGDETN